MTEYDDLLGASRARELNLDDFGGPDALVAKLPDLVDHPLLALVVRLLGQQSESGANDVLAAVAAPMHEAISATHSPALYRDCADIVTQSPHLLSAVGTALATSAMSQASQPPPDASPVQTLRAADALEIAVQLRLANFAPRWDLFTLLNNYTGSAGEPYARAVLRATVACVEQWAEAIDLVSVVRRAAGLDPPIGPTPDAPELKRSAGTGSASTVHSSDGAVALARLSTLQALRAPDHQSTLDHLAATMRYLEPVLAHDERPDAAIANDIADLLRQLITDGAITDPEIVQRFRDNSRDWIHLDPGRGHWAGSRVGASHVAWAKLVDQLSLAHAFLGEVSWYQASVVIDDIVDLYRTTSSSLAYRLEDDGRAVHDIVAPTLETGFAQQASLLRHLTDHVKHLQQLADDGVASAEELEDLPAATELRDAAQVELENPYGTYPKAGAGVTASAESSPAEMHGVESRERVIAAVEKRRRSSTWITDSVVANELLDRIRAGFSGADDFKDDVEECADLISYLLVTFLWDRSNLGEAEAPYIYREDATEEDLATDLRNHLRASGRLSSVDTEVRHIGGGRVDIKFGFPGFNLYVELKADKSGVPVPDKKSYLGQAAAYTVSEPRIGFLLVLKLLPGKRELPSHLLNSVEVVQVSDSDGESRHIAAMTLAGYRTKPSSM